MTQTQSVHQFSTDLIKRTLRIDMEKMNYNNNDITTTNNNNESNCAFNSSSCVNSNNNIIENDGKMFNYPSYPDPYLIVILTQL